jgi:hypothetical protein
METSNKKRDPSFFGWLMLAGAALIAWLSGNRGEPEELRHPDVHFEASDINARGVLLTGAGILLSVWIVTVLLYFLFEHFAHIHAEQSPPALPINAHGVALPPEPRLQVQPSRDLQEVKAAAENELHSYQWVDRKNGIVAIPIDRAMKLLVQRGIPPQSAPPKMFFEPRAGSRMTGFEGKVEPEETQ